MKTWKQSLVTIWSALPIYRHGVNVELTFAGPGALRPAMINVFVARTSAVLIPSTTRSATTDSAGFLKRATC